MNSTTVLNTLEALTKLHGDNETISIETLAEKLGVTLPVIVSLLTELEQRDKIIMEISVTSETANPRYSGTVRLMDTPPDEEVLAIHNK